MKAFRAVLTGGSAVLAAAVLVVPAPRGDGFHPARAITDAFLGHGGAGGGGAGEMEFSLWPHPKVTFRDARFGAGSDPWLRADRIEARIALGRLLFGRILFEDVRFTGAELRLDGASPLEGLPQAVRGAREVRADGVRLRLTREGRPLDVSRLLVRRLEENALFVEADVPASAGAPLAFEGMVGVDAAGGPLRLRASLAHGEARWAYAGTADLDALAEAGGILGAGKVRFESPDAGELLPGMPAAALSAAGEMALRAGAAGIGAEVANLVVRSGGVEMRGALDVAPGERPRIALALSARRADVGGPADAPEALRALAEAAEARLAGLDAEVLLAVEALRAGGQIVRNATVRLVAEDGRVRVTRADARLPGGADLTLAGGRAPGPEGALFHGRASLSAHDLRALVRWLGGDLEAFRADRLRSLDLKGTLTLHGDGWQLADAEGTVDSWRFRGALTRPSGGEEGPLRLALALPQLDPGAFAPGPANRGGRFGAGMLALLGQLPDAGTEVDLAIAELRAGEGVLRDLTVRGVTGSGGAVLRQLRIGDFAGARFEMEGELPLPYFGEAMEARIEMEAGDARALAEALGVGGTAPLAPPFGAGGTLALRGDPDRIGVSLEGEAFGATLAAVGSVELVAGRPPPGTANGGAGLWDWIRTAPAPSVELDVRVRGTAAGGDGAAFEIAGEVVGGFDDLALRRVRIAASGLEGTAEGSLAVLDGARPKLDLDLDLQRITGVLPLPSPARPGRAAAALPAWARLGLPALLLAGVDADLRLRADTVDLGGVWTTGDARGVLAFRAGEASFRSVRARVGEGWLRAEGVLRTDSGAESDFELRLSNVPLAGLRAGPGFVVEETHVNGVMRLQTARVTGLAMAQTLFGSGWLALRGGAVRGLGLAGEAPSALHRARSGFVVRGGVFVLEDGTAEVGGWRGEMAGEVSAVDRTANVKIVLHPRTGPGGDPSVVRVRGPWSGLPDPLAANGSRDG